jgi:hypothetical protein
VNSQSSYDPQPGIGWGALRPYSGYLLRSYFSYRQEHTPYFSPPPSILWLLNTYSAYTVLLIHARAYSLVLLFSASVHTPATYSNNTLLRARTYSLLLSSLASVHTPSTYSADIYPTGKNLFLILLIVHLRPYSVYLLRSYFSYRQEPTPYSSYLPPLSILQLLTPLILLLQARTYSLLLLSSTSVYTPATYSADTSPTGKNLLLTPLIFHLCLYSGYLLR